MAQVCVKSYTRSDGTKVKGYCYSRDKTLNLADARAKRYTSRVLKQRESSGKSTRFDKERSQFNRQEAKQRVLSKSTTASPTRNTRLQIEDARQVRRAQRAFKEYVSKRKSAKTRPYSDGRLIASHKFSMQGNRRSGRDTVLNRLLYKKNSRLL